MNTKGIKFLAVLAVLAMAFAVFAVISDNSDEVAADTTERTVMTFADYKTCMEDTTTTKIILGADITGTVSGTTVTKTKTLVLNGKTIDMTASYKTAAKVTNNATLTVDGTVSGSKIIGSLLAGYSTNDNGNLVINGGTYQASLAAECAIQNNGTCTDSDITISNATITSTDDTFYIAGGGDVLITNCIINGYTGIYIKAGNVTVDGTKITATGAAADPVPNGNGASSTGDGIIIDSKTGYLGNINLTIKGDSEVSSANRNSICETYTDGTTTAAHSIVIESGKFSSPFAAGSKMNINLSDYFKAAVEAGTASIAINGGSYTDLSAVPYGSSGKTITLAANFTNAAAVVIPAGITFEIAAGKTLTNTGSISLGDVPLLDLSSVKGKVSATGTTIKGYTGSEILWGTVGISSEDATNSAVSYTSTYNSTKGGFDIVIESGKVTLSAPIYETQALTVNAGATLKIGGDSAVVINGTTVNNGTIEIPSGKTLTSKVEISGSGTLAIKGTYNSHAFEGGNQATTCNVDVYQGAKWIGKNGEKYVMNEDDEAAIIVIAASGDKKLLSFKQVMNSGNATIKSATYDIVGAITVKNGSWINNDYTNTVTIEKDGIITLAAAETIIGASSTVSLVEGAAFSGTAANIITVAGELIYAVPAQAYGHAYVLDENHGRIVIAGASEEKVVVDDDVTDVIDASTFEDTNATVIVTNKSVKTVDVPADKAVVINAKLTDAVLDVSAENAEVAVNLGTAGSSFIVDTGVGKLKATGLKGSFTFTKGSIVVEAKDWSGGSMELEDGDVVKFKGNVIDNVSFTLKEGASSATVIIEKGETVTITAGATVTIAPGITLDVYGTITGAAKGGETTATIEVNKSSTLNGIMLMRSGSKTVGVEGCTITLSGSGDKNVVYSGSNINGAIITPANWKGMDANGGTWSYDSGSKKLILNGYSGSYNFGAVISGGTATIADTMEKIDLTGVNKITYSFTDKYANPDGGMTLFGKTNGIDSITTTSSGSLEIAVDISKVPTGKLFPTAKPLVVIKADVAEGSVVINGVGLKITVSGSNSAWKATDTKGMTITALDVKDKLELFQADIDIEVMAAYSTKSLVGINANNSALSVTNSYVDISATIAIKDVGAAESTVRSSSMSLIGDAIFKKDLTISNASNVTVDGNFIAEEDVTVSQESLLSLKDAVLGNDAEDKISNMGHIVTTGNIVITAKVDNAAHFDNSGMIGVYAGEFNNTGIFDNSGSFFVYAQTAVTNASNTINFEDIADYRAAIGSKILLSSITLNAGKISFNANGSANVEATLAFLTKDGIPFVPKDDALLVFDGVLTPSQVKPGEYSLVLTSETAKITIAYKVLTTEAYPQVGSNYTMSVSGAIMSNADVLTYIENNKARTGSGATAVPGATVTDGITGKWTTGATGNFVASDGKVNNSGSVVIYGIPAGKETIVAADAVYEGNIVLYKAATFAGTVNGNIASEDDVTVTGEITGNIVSEKSVTVKDMEGDILAKGNVTVTNTMAGDIDTKGNVAVKNILGNIIMNAGAKTITFSGKAIGTLTYNSEYKANKDDTTKTVAVNKLGFATDLDSNVVLSMVAGVDADGTTPGKAGYFSFYGAPAALGEDKAAAFDVAEGIFGVDTSVDLKVGYSLVIEKDVTLEVAKIATLNATEAALVVSKDAIRHYEVGPDAAVTYGKVDCIMSFETSAGYYVYSDVAFALSNCDENATLTVEKNAPISTAVAVKDGVNIIVKNVTLTFNGKDVVMGDGAKITLEGTGKIIFKASGDNVAAADADKDLEYDYYSVSGTIEYADNAVLFNGVRFTDESTIVGVAATSTADAKISTTLLYNEGVATITAGIGTGAITLGNDAYALTKDAKGDVDKYTLVKATFIVGLASEFDATSIIDAYGKVKYNKDDVEIIDKVTMEPTVVGVEGVLNLLNDTTIKGIYGGVGVLTVAKSLTVAAYEAPEKNKEKTSAPTIVGLKITDKDGENAMAFTAVQASSDDTFVIKYEKIKDVNVLTLAGDLGNGIIEGALVAYLKGVDISEDAAIAAPTVYVTAASTAVGSVGAQEIYMKSTDSTYAELDYQVSYEAEGFTFYAYLVSIDLDEITDITIDGKEAKYNLSALTGKDAGAKIDLSGSDINIAVAEGKTLVIDQILIIGTPITDLGDEGSSLSGKIIIKGTNYIVAYSDVDLLDADFEGLYGADKKADAVYSILDIEDVLYASIIAVEHIEGVDAGISLAKADKSIVPAIEGYTFTTWCNYDGTSGAESSFVGETNAYADFKAMLVNVTVKFVTGITYYCNGIEFAIYDTPTKVDYNSVFTAKISDTTKYQGTPLVNGKNSLILTEDTVIVGSGVEPIPVPPQPEPEPVVGDSGLSLTDILLIVLVILIAIMVVILVLRLNRS